MLSVDHIKFVLNNLFEIYNFVLMDEKKIDSVSISLRVC